MPYFPRRFELPHTNGYLLVRHVDRLLMESEQLRTSTVISFPLLEAKLRFSDACLIIHEKIRRLTVRSLHHLSGTSDVSDKYFKGHPRVFQANSVAVTECDSTNDDYLRELQTVRHEDTQPTRIKGTGTAHRKSRTSNFFLNPVPESPSLPVRYSRCTLEIGRAHV